MAQAMNAWATLRLRLNRADASRVGREAGAAVEQGLGRSMAQVGAGMLAAGGAMSMLITRPLVELGRNALQASNEFGQGMANVNSILQTSQGEIDAMGNSLKALSNELPLSAADLSTGLYQVASAGFDGADAMAVMEASARAAAAGLSNTESSSRAIIAALNSYGLSAKDAAAVSDVLFKGVDEGIFSFDELAASMGNYVALSGQLKVPLNEMIAGQAALSKVGLSAAEASTSLNGILRQMVSPSDALSAAIKKLGYESGSAMLKQEGLQGTMEQLSKVAGNNKEKWSALFPEIRALRGAMGLTANSGKTLDKSMQALMDTTGATGKALGEQAKGGMFQFSVEANRTKNFLIDIGDSIKTALLPVLDRMNDVLEQVGEWWKSLSPGMQTTIITVLALVAALGPLMVVIGGLMLAVGGMITMWPVIAGAMSGVVAAAAPVVAIVAAVAAGLKLLWDVISSNQSTLDFFAGLVETVWQALTDLWDFLVAQMKPALDEIGMAWNKLVQALQPLVPVLKIIGAVIGGVIVAAFAVAVGAIIVFTKAIGFIINVIRMVINGVSNFVGWWIGAWQKVGAFFVDIWDKASETVKRWIDNIKGWFGAVAAWVKDKWDGVVQFFKDIMNDIIGFWNEHVASITVNIPNVKGVIGLDGQSFTPFPHITPLAKGGIVLGPTLALIGEAGPEAVVPLRSGAPFGLGGGLVMIRGTLDIGPDGTATIRGIAAEEDVTQSKFQTRIARMGVE